MGVPDLEKDSAVLRWVEERPSDFEERVLSRLVREGTCKVWHGARIAGYGVVALPVSLGVLAANGDAKIVRVHRAVWVAASGVIPEMTVLDHDGPNGCHNRACANIDHLELTDYRGSSATSTKNPTRALSPAQARRLRYLYERGVPWAVLMQVFSVSRNVVWQVGTGRTYTDI